MDKRYERSYMYLHPGSDYIIKSNDIIGVFDMDNTTITKRGRKILAAAEKNGEIIDLTDELPASYVVTANGLGQRIYVSSLSAAAMVRRLSAGRLIQER